MTPAATCLFRPATRTMKNSSRLLAKIARNLTRSRRGEKVSSGERQHARVEVEPGQLPIDETLVYQRPEIWAIAPSGNPKASMVTAR